MMQGEQQGSRKVILTKWMLVIFTIITLVYLGLAGINDWSIESSFYTMFVLGLGAIGGAFTVGNIFEHTANAEKYKSLANQQKDGNRPSPRS